MANLILASKREVKSGAMMWNVYRSVDNVKSDSFFFAEDAPLKALKYAFLLRKRTGAVIPKGIYNKLMAEVKASKSAIAEDEGVVSSEEGQPLNTTPSTLHTERSEVNEPSPIAKAVADMKAKHPDAILLMRTGDFYTAFGDDAKAVSEVCGLTLTRRSDVQDITEWQAAFPAVSLDTWLPKLVRAGKRVAICDALADMKPEPEKKSRKRSTKKSESK